MRSSHEELKNSHDEYEFAWKVKFEIGEVRNSHHVVYDKSVLLIKMTSNDALSIGTDVKPPVLFKGEYEQWKDRFLDFIDIHENREFIKKSIDEGLMKPVTAIVPDEDNESSDSEDCTENRGIKTKKIVVDFSIYTPEQKRRHKADKQARSLLLQSIPNEIYIKIDSYKATSKKMWDQLEKMLMGSKIGNQMKVVNCINNYEGESLEDTYERFVSLLNELDKNKNEEEVEEEREEKKKSEKPVNDPVALVAEKKKEKEKKDKRRLWFLVLVMLTVMTPILMTVKTLSKLCCLLTRAFQKKFYKKSGSNSQRYSSGSRNYEHKERVEGRRFDDRRSEGKKHEERKPEERYVNQYGEKKTEEPVKCYKCGKIGHFAKDCRKSIVRNSEYYNNKMLLANQKEADKALMVEDDYWLDHLDYEDEKEETAHMCLMGKEVKYDESDEETFKEFLSSIRLNLKSKSLL
ncbi:hypothetical protein L6452_08835 [Arctium lappa]|uniref:Uncharacterized protein n=1 Tax=Arctium lappa TaxID=4217 RepID=A0ACB9DJ66_ARCLA|nr:hypothetical protein L6452_08835 [Arctium lappa]